MFEITDVNYKNILFDINLNIQREKSCSIIGNSGSGKTTFLKLLNNMINYDTGSIKYKGKELLGYNPVQLRRKIMMLPQNPVVFPGSILDNFRLAEEYAEKKINNKDIYLDILNTLKLNYNLNKSASKLSGGEKQRLALARIILLQPETLLLDEPSSALDEKTEKSIIEKIYNFSKDNKITLIMVTHSHSIAESYSDEIITIKNGHIDKIYKPGDNNG